MNETYQPVPYDKRPSQNIGVWDYVRQPVALFLLPFALGGAGWLLGKQRPAPDYATKPEKMNMLQAYRESLRRQFGNNEHEGGLYAVYGLKIGIAVAAFMLWRKKEKKGMEVADVVGSVKEIAPLHMTNEDLQKDNELVKKMIAYEKQKQQRLIDDEVKLPSNYRERITAQDSAESGLQK